MKCDACGVEFDKHLGVVACCRKAIGLRAELQVLVSECESAIRVLQSEFGVRTVTANFPRFLMAVDSAKRIIESSGGKDVHDEKTNS